MKNKYSTKLTRNMLTGLYDLIEKLLLTNAATEDDKMLFCLLEEIRQSLYNKMDAVKPMYTVKLTPAQSFAIRILYSDYVMTSTTYMGNKLHSMSNEISQHYQI